MVLELKNLLLSWEKVSMNCVTDVVKRITVAKPTEFCICMKDGEGYDAKDTD